MINIDHSTCAKLVLHSLIQLDLLKIADRHFDSRITICIIPWIARVRSSIIHDSSPNNYLTTNIESIKAMSVIYGP